MPQVRVKPRAARQVAKAAEWWAAPTYCPPVISDARPIEFMQANLCEDISVLDICRAACASRRSMQYCLKVDRHRPVTSIASTLGFSSVRHFTSQYKLMFEELPSQTAGARRAGRR